MLRSLFVDPVRLLLRKAMPHLIAFSCWPTRREMRALARRAVASAVAEAFPPPAPKHDGKHQTLH